MKSLLTICFIGLMSASFSAFSGDSPKEQIKASIELASQVKALPKARSMVIFSRSGESVVLTDNPRWVVKGTLFDMWQNKEIHSVSQLKGAEKIIPLSSLRVNTTDVLDMVIRQDKRQTLTVFLDPFAANTPSVVSILTQYAKDYQLRFIFTALSQSSIEKLGGFSCALSKGNTDDLLNQLRTQDFPKTSSHCLQKTMMNSYGLSQFLHISTSPTLIAPNDVFSEGMPTQLMHWLSENKG